MTVSSTESLTIEAGSAEQALEEITSRLGSGAEIMNARKVRRGGLGGFFARELVQITARPRSTDREGRQFDTMLHEALAESAPPAPAPVAEPDQSTVQQAPTTSEWRLAGSANWSVTELARHDLPSSVIQAVMELDPRDDLGWIAAIAGAVAPWCRPLPAGDGVLVGPEAARIGMSLQIPIVDAGGHPPYRGQFAVPTHPDGDHAQWLEEVRGERWLHLVVGDRGSLTLLNDEVLAVSWSSSLGVAAALRLASNLGLVLGYGMTDHIGAEARRATAVDVALAIRDLMGQR